VIQPINVRDTLERELEMSKRMGVGIIGCGNISATYLQSVKAFPLLDLRVVSDLDPEASRKRAAEFGLQAVSVDELLADPSIEMVINLTVPRAHVPVGLRILAAGKHLYSEKPLGVSSTEAAHLLAEARRANLRVGCAPDTFLGGSHQTCRRLIDEGAIGRPLGGTAIFMCPGHER
jgi:predicted dehydrogenase